MSSSPHELASTTANGSGPHGSQPRGNAGAALASAAGAGACHQATQVWPAASISSGCGAGMRGAARHQAALPRARRSRNVRTDPAVGSARSRAITMGVGGDIAGARFNAVKGLAEGMVTKRVDNFSGDPAPRLRELRHRRADPAQKPSAMPVMSRRKGACGPPAQRDPLDCKGVWHRIGSRPDLVFSGRAARDSIRCQTPFGGSRGGCPGRRRALLKLKAHIDVLKDAV